MWHPRPYIKVKRIARARVLQFSITPTTKDEINVPMALSVFRDGNITPTM